MSKRLQTVLCAVVLVGCASSASQQEPSQPSSSTAPSGDVLGTAFFGLTVKDCYATAADCVRGISDPHTWVSAAADCQSQLNGCFGDVVEEAVSTVKQGATEVAQCGHDGLTCFRSAEDFDAVVTCRGSVEGCVDSTVKDLTGIELPTTKQILDVAVETEHEVVAVPTAVAENTVDTAQAVTHVAGDAVDSAVTAAAGVVDAVETSAEQLLDCAVKGHQCMWEKADFLACSDAYQGCVGEVQ